MKRAQKKRVLKPWSRTDLKTLKSGAGRQPAGKIAKALKRTEGAVRQKALTLGISLRV